MATKASNIPQTVGDLLKTQVLSVAKPDDALDAAFRKMAENKFHHLPVVNDNGELVGILSDRDIRAAADSPFLHEVEKVVKKLHNIHVKQAMSTSVVTVNEDAPIVEAAKLMRVSNVGGLPVVKNDGKICIGCVTRTDLVDHLIRVLEPL